MNGSDASAMAKDYNSGLMGRLILGNGEMGRPRASANLLIRMATSTKAIGAITRQTDMELLLK